MNFRTGKTKRAAQLRDLIRRCRSSDPTAIGDRLERTVHGMEAEGAIGLELRFAEELIGS